MMTIVQYPKRSVGLAVAASILLHLALAAGMRYAPAMRVAMGFGVIEYVDADYNRAILIDFSKGFRYPPGFLGFVAPTKIRSLEEIAREEARRARREAARRAAATKAGSTPPQSGTRSNVSTRPIAMACSSFPRGGCALG